MASTATNLVPPLNIGTTTVAEYPNKLTLKTSLKTALTYTLYTTPSLLGQSAKTNEFIILSNRYRLTAYIALVKRAQAPPGSIGPLAVTYEDGNGPKTVYIGAKPSNPLNGQGSQSAMSSGQTHSNNINAMFGGVIQFMAAPGTAITISIPVTGQVEYLPNIALETF